jgi:hypothetical protein
MLIILNGKKVGFLGENKLYIGRANDKLSASPLANPFVLGRDGDRLQVIEKFRKWLWPQIKQWRKTGEMTEAVVALKDLAIAVKGHQIIVLTCWCKPEACHGDVIDSCVQWLISQDLV